MTIQVLEQEDISGVYQVSSKGTIEFPILKQKIKAAGFTCRELASLLKARLEEGYFYRATVFVYPFDENTVNANIPSSSRSNTGGLIYIYGMVRNPGVVKISSDEVLTVSKIIIRSGGFQEFADKKKVKLVRKSSVTGKAETKTLNLVRIIDHGKLEEDVPVKDGDMIVVPERFFNF